MKKIILFLSVVMLSSCMKDSFDAPADPVDPGLTRNYSISDLKQDFKASGQTVWTIEDDRIIEAIVIANDIGGNFYKEIVIQDIDNKAAIGLKINRTNLYNDFPVGRKVFIKAQGMAMTDDNNLIVMGGYVDTVSIAGAKSLGEAPPSAIGKTILKGTLNHDFQIEDLSMNQLSESYHYKLVRIKDVEFDCADINLTYADAANLSDASRTLNDKFGNSILVRSSGYSTFAGTKVAQGKGEILGIFTVYRNDFQLKLRDLADVNMNDTNRTKRCGSGGGGGGPATQIDISDLRAMYNGSNVEINDKYIEGVVISDRVNGNMNSQNIAIQDGTGGIVVRFSSSHNYSLGDKLKITFREDNLTKFNELTQIYGDISDVETLGTETPIATTVTISDIINNIDKYESTLVKIENASFTSSGTFNFDDNIVSDATGNIAHFTSPSASFNGDNTPSGTFTMTAIVGRFSSTKQVSIRKLSDIQ